MTGWCDFRRNAERRSASDFHAVADLDHVDGHDTMPHTMTTRSTAPPDPVECIIFDLFGVLVAFDDRLVYDRIAQRCARPTVAAEQMLDLVSRQDLICGRTSLRQLHAQIAESHGFQAPFELFESLWRSSYSEPMPGMRDLLSKLEGQCRLVLLSNIDRCYWATVERSLPELGSFDAKLLSFEQGVAKPDAQAFRRAVAASGSTVDRCWFVDDKPENVEAAAAIGLRGHRFQGCLALQLALRAAGLRVD